MIFLLFMIFADIESFVPNTNGLWEGLGMLGLWVMGDDLGGGIVTEMLTGCIGIGVGVFDRGCLLAAD